MIATLLGWIGLPQWALELIALGLVGGAVWLWHHETFESGVAAEVAKIQTQAAKDTATLTAKATSAEHSHDTELATLIAYRDSHPEQPVRLCLSPDAASVQAAAVKSVSGGSVASASAIQSVPAGNSGSGAGTPGPDISGLLESLAARADQITAQARELQERQL